ncbi:VanZ family protein [Teredinibacter sp. KSP-S5-2]|uniref:VanZ family protein n=1 Tax=Teredinibacter sp. KSP-S5-2 TaxID=3034506 RepID=UPI0029348D1E|nr:VanZ family protein [Teredinibacter sp. KSP-S5-2]WNO09492.1 VanZ family protein [Teredinibacter sp. KSP-S5-2]
MRDLNSIISNASVTKIRQTQFLVAIAIFSTLSLIPNPDSLGINASNTALHFIGNILLILSAWVACLGRYNIWMPLLFAIPYSILIELSQGLTATRQPEVVDILANIAGLAVGFLLCILLEKGIKAIK